MTKELVLHRAKRINGWMSDAELCFLAETARKSDLIYEIGSFTGRSTRALGDNVKGKVFAIDPWESANYDGHENGICFFADETTYNVFYCNNADLIESGAIVPFRERWEDYIPVWDADFIFIDGDHRYENVKRDIIKALRYITKPGGIIAGHDYILPWTGVLNAVNGFFRPEAINVIDSIWWVQL